MDRRCEECGSWEAECASDKPVDGCGCARCLRESLRLAVLAEEDQRRRAKAAEVATANLKVQVEASLAMVRMVSRLSFDAKKPSLEEFNVVAKHFNEVFRDEPPLCRHVLLNPTTGMCVFCGVKP